MVGRLRFNVYSQKPPLGSLRDGFHIHFVLHYGGAFHGNIDQWYPPEIELPLDSFCILAKEVLG